MVPDRFTYAAHPSRHLSGRVDVMRLHILREPLLGGEVQLHHGLGERLGVPSQSGLHTEHCTSEGAVDLKIIILILIKIGNNLFNNK